MERRLQVVLLLSLLLSSLGLALAAPDSAGPAPAALGCVAARCAWALPSDPGPLTVAWVPFVDEVQPNSWTADAPNLTVNVTNARSAGTFMFSSVGPVPAPVRGSFSVWLRATGDVARFALLLREEGQEEATHRDTVYFAPAHREWTFVSFPFERGLNESSGVRIALRAEISTSASGGIAFAQPRLTADPTTWFVANATTPFAWGPYASTTFDQPGNHVVHAVTPNGTVVVPARISTVKPTVNASIDIDSSMRLRVHAEVSSPFHPPLLANGNFLDGAAGWRLAPHEFGLGEGSLTANGGTLQLTVPNAVVGGSIWATQTVAVTPGVPLEFVWRAHDDRGIASYAPVIVAGENRTEMTQPPGGPLGVGGRIAFTPNTSVVEVQLRVTFEEGGGGSAWFDEVELRRAYAYEWRTKGILLPVQGPTALLPAGTARTGSIVLDVTGAFGGTTRTTIPLPPGPTLTESAFVLTGTPRATVSLVNIPIPIALSISPGAAFNVLATPGPAREWQVEDGEAPGRVRIEYAGSEIRVVLSTIDDAAGGGVQQRLATPGGGLPYALGFEYRTSGQTERVESLARYHSPGDTSFEETRRGFRPSPDWTPATLLASPSDGRSLTLLGLRGIVPAGAEGVVEFRNITYTPALKVDWAGATGQGLVGSISASKPGVYPWNATVTTSGGLVLKHSATAYFVLPVRPFVTLSGEASAAWNPSNLPPDYQVVIEGPRGAAADAGAGVVVAPEFIPGNYQVLAVGPHGERTLLGESTLTNPVGAGPARTVWQATRGQPFDIKLAFDAPTVTAVTLELTSPTGRAQVIPLRLNATTRTWDAAWTPHLRTVPGTYSTTVTMTDTSGATGTYAFESLTVAPGPGAREGVGMVSLMGAAAVLAIWLPRGRAGVVLLAQRFAVTAADFVGVFGATYLVSFIVLGREIPDGLESAVFATATLAGMMCAFALAILQVRGHARRDMVRLAIIVGLVAATCLIGITSLQNVEHLSGFPRRIIPIAAIGWLATSAFTRIVRQRFLHAVSPAEVDR